MFSATSLFIPMRPAPRIPRANAGFLRTSLALVCASSLALGCKSRDSDHEQAPQPIPAQQDIFARDSVAVIHLRMDNESIRRLKKSPRGYVDAAFISGPVNIDEIGVRLKGARSARDFQNKPAFKLRFNRRHKKATFQEQTKLSLNNMVEDPTMLREMLGYPLYQAMGVPAPRVGYARVYVNESAYGLYTAVEHVGKRFLSRHFADPSGGLYEGELGCDLFADDVDWFDQDSGDRGDDARAPLRLLTEKAAGPAEGLFDATTGALARDEFLAYLAVSAIIGDFDGYRHSHNYRIYHEPTEDKWYFIPWGIDRVFQRSLSIHDSRGLLAKRCFADPSCRLDYVRTVKQAIERFESMNLAESARTLGDLIAPAVDEDRRRPYSDHEMTRERRELLAFIERRPGEIRAQLTCIDENGLEIDRDGDGHGCMDCDDEDPAIHPGVAESCDGVDNDCSGLVDDNPVCACATETIDDAVFHLCDLPMPWHEARAFCEQKDMQLAAIDNAAQMSALYERGRAIREQPWWIGLADIEREGLFRWHDGTRPAFTFWQNGNPNNEGCNQDCAIIRDSSPGYWRDTHCGQHHAFICRATP